MSPSPAQLSPSAVNIPDAQVRAAEILEDVTKARQPVRCTIPVDGELLATGPLSWPSISTPEGFFFPKKGDSATVCLPLGGKPVILTWEPSASAPDAPLT